MMEHTVTQEKNVTPLKAYVERALTNYFSTLNGEKPNDLYKMVIGETEYALLQYLLVHTKGNQSKAAQLLGINRGTLRKKLKQYGLE